MAIAVQLPSHHSTTLSCTHMSLYLTLAKVASTVKSRPFTPVPRGSSSLHLTSKVAFYFSLFWFTESLPISVAPENQSQHYKSFFLRAYYVSGTGYSRPGRLSVITVPVLSMLLSQALPSHHFPAMPQFTVHQGALSKCMPTCHPAQLLRACQICSFV